MKKERKLQKFNMEEIRQAILDTSAETSIYVACDSKEKARETFFVTVVVIHFDSCHGGRVFYDEYVEPRRLRMRDKLLAEVYKSTETALLISDAVGERKLEVHLDLNPDPKEGSYIVHKEGLAYVKAYGFNAVAKYTSWAAYTCADHLAKMGAKRRGKRK